jgi:hypothetical protein
MKSAIPWVLVVLLLGGVYFLYSEGKSKDAQIAQSAQQSAEFDQLKAENEELSKLKGAGEENARLRKDNEELPRLRGEVQRLNQQVKDLERKLTAAQAQGATLQQQQQQMSQLATENQNLKNQAQSNQQAAAQAAVQTMGKLHSITCVRNLRLLDSAKQRWAQDQGKGADAVPMPDDLLAYLPQNTFPVCPDGGAYTLNAVQVPAQCSVPGHATQ